jgi:threonine aldolase
MHLDGARIWNAMAATRVAAKDWGRHFDTVAVCYSKGLGAPVGSALLGPKDVIAYARRIRKLFGGAMRQAGYIAAACRYALDHNVERIAEDHENAQTIAAAVGQVPGLTLTPHKVESNLVWFEVSEKLGTAKNVAEKLKTSGVLVAPLGANVIRAVTHLDVDRTQCQKAAEAIRRLAG